MSTTCVSLRAGISEKRLEVETKVREKSFTVKETVQGIYEGKWTLREGGVFHDGFSAGSFLHLPGSAALQKSVKDNYCCFLESPEGSLGPVVDFSSM